ncbi:MAG: formylglycine-generating enzyme family protein [Vallitaleaceae bacterium]|nr:formylglycine-generating enzyme family protein [Vallitaleaceae bacterium]
MINADNVVVFDNTGIPSIMVRFKKCTNADLFPGGSNETHPMFIIDGEEVDEIFISKYPNTIINGKAYSLPYKEPATNIKHDEAAEACYSKGDGWHMLTAAEWAYLALESKRNKTLPHGNTNWGKDFNHPEEAGVCYDGSRTLTGSGPATWAHDHTPFGVHDLCGNIWEMISGLRLLNGEIQVIENNNAANKIDTSRKSDLWKPVIHEGKPTRFVIDDECNVKLTNEGESGGWDGCRWDELTTDIEVPETLKALALYPVDDEEVSSWMFTDTEGERLPIRGGSWYFTSGAGVFDLNLNNPRSGSNYFIGFRSAFYRKQKTE